MYLFLQFFFYIYFDLKFVDIISLETNVKKIKEDYNSNAPTTFTCDQCTHHIMMNTFLNPNNSKNRDLRVSKVICT